MEFRAYQRPEDTGRARRCYCVIGRKKAMEHRSAPKPPRRILTSSDRNVNDLTGHSFTPFLFGSMNDKNKGLCRRFQPLLRSAEENPVQMAGPGSPQQAGAPPGVRDLCSFSLRACPASFKPQTASFTQTASFLDVGAIFFILSVAILNCRPVWAADPVATSWWPQLFLGGNCNLALSMNPETLAFE